MILLVTKVLQKSDFFLCNCSKNRSKAQRAADESSLRAPGEAETARSVEDAGCCEAEKPFILRWESRFQQDSAFVPDLTMASTLWLDG